MSYQVLLNERYMNSFKSYSEACELVERLENKYPNAIVKIIEKY